MIERKFGKLIGVLEVGNSYCKFLIYALKNSEILTCHEIKLNENDNDEYCPQELWKCIQDVIHIVVNKNLQILEIEKNDIIAIGVTNQRESTLLWNKKSGKTFNMLQWYDDKCTEIESTILSRTRNKKNYMRSICGLPFNICFSAIKIKWLIENNKCVQDSIRNDECYFGNLDAWLLWNLTGGKDGGIHACDVTNASRTLLMDLETLQWDKRLCNFFKIPMNILPKIRSNSEIYGYIKINGSNILEGIPIASCMGNINSAMIGQLCLKAGQIECNIENDLNVMFNTGQEIIYSENDLLSTVAFQLGPNTPPFYALEGFIGNSCASVEWLRNSILPAESNNNLMDENISPVSSFIGMRNVSCFKRLRDDELVFVPALRGMCAPNFLFQAKGLLSGFSINTTSHQLFMAAKESICFQTKTILESIRKDCKTWPAINKLIVGGDFSEDVDFLQILADLCSLTVERPQISSPVSLGTMLSAALTMKCISLEDFKCTSIPPIDSYSATISSDVSDQRYLKWLSKFKTSSYLNDQKHQEVDTLINIKTAHQFILDSLPGCLYLFSSYVIYVLSQQLKEI